MATQTLLTVDEYLDLPLEEGRRHELDEGRLVEMASPTLEHGDYQGRLFYFFHVYRKQQKIPLVVSLHAEFVLSDDPPVARQPDVCVIMPETASRLEYVRGAYRGHPELAIEVVSKSDVAVELDRKVDQYLAAGVQSVWIFYPETRHVMIYRASGETKLLRPGDDIEEPGLFPGLRIPVAEVFEL
ncbi:MAG: Uma2 family endonuclease [Bryobacteraceae bacterium]